MRESNVKNRVRKMLAAELSLDEQALTDDFQWIEAMGAEDAEHFLSEVDDVFTRIAPGFSFGHGRQPFDHMDEGLWKRIASVGGLIEHC